MLLSLPKIADVRPTCFVTDGGHHENLGIQPLLERRCRLIIATDVGQDSEYRFDDLMRVLRRSSTESGIDIQPVGEAPHTMLDSLIPPNVHTKRLANKNDVKELDSAELLTEKNEWSQRDFLVFRIQYPPRANEADRRTGT